MKKYLKNTFVIDRKFRKARLWSNRELLKFAHLFSGDIINVSGWKDIDKNGRRYKDYFRNASNYFVSNYKSEASGFQGNLENEFFLDLTKKLPKKYNHKYDVVYNNTVLEHIFEVDIAFKNLCDMSKDIVIIVVPFLQEQHADYGDYWRFTPLAVEKLFKKNNMDLIYLNFNDNSNESIYIFAIGTKKKSKWKHKINCKKKNKMIGTKIIKNFRFRYFLSYILK